MYFLVHMRKTIWCDLLNTPTSPRYQVCLDQLALSTMPTVPSPTQTTQQAWPGQPDWHGAVGENSAERRDPPPPPLEALGDIKTPWEHSGILGEPLQMRRDSWLTMPSLARSRACQPWLLFVSSSKMLICARYLKTTLFKHPRDHITKE